MYRLLRPVAVLALLAVPIVSCSSAQPPPTFSGVRTSSIGIGTWMSAGTGIDDDMDMHRLGGAELNGPHYTLGLAWTSSGTTLSSADARELNTSPVRAPKGSGLVVAEVDASDTYAAYDGGHVEVSVTVAGNATPVRGLPLAPQPNSPYASHSAAIVVSAPHGAPVRLRATDAGRTEELDLRTGKVLVDSYDMRQSRTLTWSGSTAVQYDYDGVPYRGRLTAGMPSPDVGSATAVASLTSYTPDLKWAPKGSMILLVPAPGLSGDNMMYGRLHEEFDDRTVFTFRTADGRTVRAQHNPRDLRLLPASVDGDETPVSFLVPAGTTAGTVTMKLAGARLTEESGESTIQQPSDKRTTVSWARGPGPLTLKVTMKS